MKRSILNIVGIEIDEKYKWLDTLCIDENVSSNDEGIYNECKAFIKIIYNKDIDYSCARKIDGEIWGCDKYIYDEKKEAKIYFENENYCIIETKQEVNEWLLIMIQILLLKNGYSLIHAAAVEKDGNALIMPSWGGVGKTASVAKLVKKGYKLLGDDLNIVSNTGEVYGFPKKFVLYFYHKDLFPEVFEKKSPKCNSLLNKFYTKIIPTVKNFLRHFPKILAFMRKHNPQSIKVSPFDIFDKEKIANNGKIKQVVWIERDEKNKVEKLDSQIIASKTTSVTMNEVFNENMCAILIMCGFNIISYDDVFIKMKQIIQNAFKEKIINQVNVSKKEHVSIVADRVIQNIKF